MGERVWEKEVKGTSTIELCERAVVQAGWKDASVYTFCCICVYATNGTCIQLHATLYAALYHLQRLLAATNGMWTSKVFSFLEFFFVIFLYFCSAYLLKLYTHISVLKSTVLRIYATRLRFFALSYTPTAHVHLRPNGKCDIGL